MAQGLGRIEQGVLRVLGDAVEGLDAVTIAAAVYKVMVPPDEPPNRYVSAPQYNSTRRALNVLAERNAVFCEADGFGHSRRRLWFLAVVDPVIGDAPAAAVSSVR